LGTLMINTALSEKTLQFLDNALIAGQDSDTKIRNLLKTEYLRSFAKYRHTDLLLSRKYGMSFDEFIKQRVVRQKEYSWDSESDAMIWETSVSGMKTMERYLGELQEADNVSYH